jgi:site-specific recombinase XerD
MKGKTQSRTVVLHDEAKKALDIYINTHMKDSKPEDKLFPISRQHADRVLRKAVKKAKVEGKVSSHSMRKSFCKKVYEKLNKDLVSTQRAMGHKSVQSTVSYLSFDQEAIDKAIKGV